MKIFPPLTEMIWPPGHSTAQVVWGHRHLLLVIVGLIATVAVWPALNAPTTPDAQSNNIASPPPVQASAASPAPSPTRDATAALQDTLTAADRAIVAPSALRSGPSVRVPPLAPRPTTK